MGQFPGTDTQLKQLLKVIRDIEEMARYTPASVGESEQWSSVVSTAEERGQNFCKVLNGKSLFSALYGTYTVALHELKAVLKASTSLYATDREEGFVVRKFQHGLSLMETWCERRNFKIN
jgi:hypothetical protein